MMTTMELALEVREAGDEHGGAILALARQDVVLNAFIIYDWLRLRNRCRFYVALRGPKGPLEGVCVIYPDERFNSVVFCGSPEGIRAILTHIRPRRAVLPRVGPEELDVVLEALGPGVGPIYDALLMTCGPDDFTPRVAHDVVRLGPEHAELFARLWAEREDRRRAVTLEQARRALSDPNRPVFAIIKSGRIVSLATIYLSMPEVSLVGGVYTVPELRGRGLATSVTSRATEEALRSSELAALIVRADNAPAIRVYEKVGYRPYKRLKWVCVGVDYPP